MVTFDCDHCESIFKSESDLENHVESAHKVITFECNQCESVFKSESDMKKHVDSIHTKDDLMRNIEHFMEIWNYRNWKRASSLFPSALFATWT